MGLDIYSYKNPKLIEDPNIIDDEDLVDELDLVYVDNEDVFLDHLCGLKNQSFYQKEDGGASFSIGVFEYTNFRENLAKLSGYIPINIPEPNTNEQNFCFKFWQYRHPYTVAVWQKEKGPFKELICFTDSNGCIGTNYCMKLSQDFKNFEEKALSIKVYDEDFFYQYKKLQAVFDSISNDPNNNGFVHFY